MTESTDFIYHYKTDAMQRLCLLLGKGYVHYTHGIVQPHKAATLHERFIQRYEIDRDVDRRYRCKRRGITNSFLVMYYCNHDQVIRWWLVNTLGHATVNELEQLKDARDRNTRLPFPAPSVFYKKHNQEPPMYEMVRLKHTTRRSNPANTPEWTWQFEKGAYDRQLHQLQLLVSWVKVKNGQPTNDSALVTQLESLKRTPGFFQSRRQAFALFQETKKRWKRLQKGDWPYGKIYVGWVGRYQNAEGYSVAQFQPTVLPPQWPVADKVVS